jgi:hypothetical protein
LHEAPIVNRWFIATALALSGVALMGALYSKLTVAAPAARPSFTKPHVVLASSSAAVVATPTPAPSGNPESERLEARRVLYETVDAFVQAGEFEKARRLLDDDQARHGDDLAPEWRDLEQSYRLIADCLERPNPRQRARAQAFAQVSQAVALKSRLLTACAARPN